MAGSEIFTTEEHNPFYCPSVPATLFLESLRRKMQHPTRHAETCLENTPELTDSSNEEHFPSFTKLLDQSICEEDLLQLVYQAGEDNAQLDLSQASDFCNSSLSSVYPRELRRPYTQNDHSILASGLGYLGSPGHSSESRRFSDFAAPAKRERSVVDINEGSFELSTKAEKIRFFAPNVLSSPDNPAIRTTRRKPKGIKTIQSAERLIARIYALEDELYGLPIGTESPSGISSLVLQLSSLFPGIRLEEKLHTAGAKSHQQIADVLASHGNLSSRVLNVLRTSEISYLDLSTSIGDEDGLNLESKDVLHVFAKPNSFVFLAEINLTGAELCQSDLVHLHGLPRLARLWLSGTGIGNEAIYYLTPLKRTLTELDVASNAKIDDDAVPALLVLTKLIYLSIQGTSISMIGLRRLAKTLQEQKREMDIEVPRDCELYVSKLANKYLMEPAPPLIAAPAAVSSLSTPALHRNISAHTHFVENERESLVKQLREVLETREADLLARALICQEPLV